MTTTFFAGFYALGMGIVHVATQILRGVRWFVLHIPYVIVGFLKHVFPILALAAAWFWLTWLFWDIVLDPHARKTGGTWIGAGVSMIGFPFLLNWLYELGLSWQHGARWTDPHSWERADREIESKKRVGTQSHG